MQTKIDYQEYLKSDYWKEIGGIPLFSCKSEIKKKLNPPRVCAGLIINKNIYEKYPEQFNKTQYGKI